MEQQITQARGLLEQQQLQPSEAKALAFTDISSVDLALDQSGLGQENSRFILTIRCSFVLSFIIFTLAAMGSKGKRISLPEALQMNPPR